MPPELAQWIVPLIVIFGTLSPAVIVGLMLYLHRLTRDDIKRLDDRVARLEHSQAKLEGLLDGLREAITRRSVA